LAPAERDGLSTTFEIDKRAANEIEIEIENVRAWTGKINVIFTTPASQ
jgi:hypothetical protein